jgi:hypothetical protein
MLQTAQLHLAANARWHGVAVAPVVSIKRSPRHEKGLNAGKFAVVHACFTRRDTIVNQAYPPS